MHKVFVAAIMGLILLSGSYVIAHDKQIYPAIDLKQIPSYDGLILIDVPKGIDVWINIITSRNTNTGRYISDKVRPVAVSIKVRPLLWPTIVHFYDIRKGKLMRIRRDCFYPARDGWLLRIGYDDKGPIFRCVFEFPETQKEQQ